MPRRTKPTGKTFMIATVADFLLVPEDRLSECLREFRIMLDMARATEQLLIGAGKTLGVPADELRVQLVPKFEWIDDGLGHVGLTIETATEAKR